MRTQILQKRIERRLFGFALFLVFSGWCGASTGSSDEPSERALLIAEPPSITSLSALQSINEYQLGEVQASDGMASLPISILRSGTDGPGERARALLVFPPINPGDVPWIGETTPLSTTEGVVEAVPAVAVTINVKGFETDNSGFRLPNPLAARVSTRRGERLALCNLAEKRNYECLVPEDASTLRFQLPGHEPSFVAKEGWSSGSTEVSPIPGARFGGQVVPEEAILTLWHGGAESPSSFVRPLMAEWPASFARGLFEFQGLRAGLYRLTADLEGFSPAERVVRLSPQEDRQEERPIELQRLLSLEVTVSPLTPPAGGHWTVILRKNIGGTSRFEDSGETNLDDFGYATLPETATGWYLVTVQDEHRNVWYAEHHDLVSDELYVEIPGVEVVGRISRGDEPVQTELLFGTNTGAKRLQMASDEEGRFEGYLPNEGLWPLERVFDSAHCGSCASGVVEGTLQLEPIEVDRGPSGKAILRIELPDTYLEGVVWREVDGELIPEPEAIVWAAREFSEPGQESGRLGTREFQVGLDEEGRFEVDGMVPGRLSIHARAHDGDSQSEWVDVHLQEGLEQPPLNLTLQNRIPVEIETVSASGSPIPDVRVVAMPTHAAAFYVNGATGPDGVAVLRLPPSPRQASILTRTAYSFQLAALDYSSSERSEGERLRVVMPHETGSIRIPRPDSLQDSWLVAVNGGAVSVLTLAKELGPMVEVFDNALLVRGAAPGLYRYCPDLAKNSTPCEEAQVMAGVEASW